MLEGPNHYPGRLLYNELLVYLYGLYRYEARLDSIEEVLRGSTASKVLDIIGPGLRIGLNEFY